MDGVPFADRAEAGRLLAERLMHLRGESVVVLGLPRGGVPVAYEVAAPLGAPLDVCIVRKMGVPVQPELAMGAVGEEGARILNDGVIQRLRVPEATVAAVERRERAEVERWARQIRSWRPRVPLTGRTVVVVDDGLATGSTAMVACDVVRAHGAARVVLAVPVAPPDWTDRLAGAADELVCVDTPTPFGAIGQFYADFTQLSDDDVMAYLDGPERTAASGDERTAGADEEVEITAGGTVLQGHLTVPAGATGLVVFVHGSGSGRHSRRNLFVAATLNRAGFGTLLFDLLTEDEERDRANVFDIDLLAGRLSEVTDWARVRPEVAGLPIAYFGASTGAAAALVAAAGSGPVGGGAPVAAVVSRGGRPDLAGDRLVAVRAPTLLIVGSNDHPVLDLNRQALACLGGEGRLAVVPGATHLFEEPGTLGQAAELARGWFAAHLTGRPPAEA